MKHRYASRLSYYLNPFRWYGVVETTKFFPHARRFLNSGSRSESNLQHPL